MTDNLLKSNIIIASTTTRTSRSTTTNNIKLQENFKQVDSNEITTEIYKNITNNNAQKELQLKQHNANDELRNKNFLALNSSTTSINSSSSSSVSSKSNSHKNLAQAFENNLSDALESTMSWTSSLPSLEIMNSTMLNTSKVLEDTTAFPAVQTVGSIIAAGNKHRATTIIVYPTVTPESVVIPIVSCIFGFPILALLLICCLRRRAKQARERDRRRNYDMQDHAVSLVRFSPIHRLHNRSARAISLRSERSMSQGFPSLELDTVIEERCSDMEQTQTETLNAESPLETVSYKMSFSSS